MSLQVSKVASSFMASANGMKYHSGLLGTLSKNPLSPGLTATMNSKYLLLQGRLSNLQSELTREQTKLNLLQTESNLDLLNGEYLFENKPLFEGESDDLVANKLDLIQDINIKRIQLLSEIRKMEVASENIQSANINFDFEEFKNEKLPETNIDSKNVERLVKD
jgi:hypothetical protein